VRRGGKAGGRERESQKEQAKELQRENKSFIRGKSL